VRHIAADRTQRGGRRGFIAHYHSPSAGLTVNRNLTVVVAKAPANPGPDTACPRVATYTLDAADAGPPWPAICMKLNTTLRILNFGPDGFTVSPAANVSGWYEAGVRQFHLVKTGTVRFTLTNPDGGVRIFTVVVNRYRTSSAGRATGRHPSPARLASPRRQLLPEPGSPTCSELGADRPRVDYCAPMIGAVEHLLVGMDPQRSVAGRRRPVIELTPARGRQPGSSPVAVRRRTHRAMTRPS
jgi:hypothetical protein